MTLPAFATLPQFAARIPGGVPGEDEKRAQAALDDASALIRSEAGKNWTTTDDELDADIPDVITTVCIAAARRAFINPEGVRREAVGDTSQEYDTANGDVYLKAAEKVLVRRSAGKRTVGTIATTREDPVAITDLGILDPVTGTVYAEVTPPGEPIPWLDAGQLT